MVKKEGSHLLYLPQLTLKNYPGSLSSYTSTTATSQLRVASHCWLQESSTSLQIKGPKDHTRATETCKHATPTPDHEEDSVESSASGTESQSQNPDNLSQNQHNPIQNLHLGTHEAAQTPSLSAKPGRGRPLIAADLSTITITNGRNGTCRLTTAGSTAAGPPLHPPARILHPLLTPLQQSPLIAAGSAAVTLAGGTSAVTTTGVHDTDATSGMTPLCNPLWHVLHLFQDTGLHPQRYVPFNKLLLPKGTIPISHATRETRKSKHKQFREVEDLTTWLEAWNRYLCARVASSPSSALELIKYQTLMVMFFTHHQAEQCIHYDDLLRQAAARDPTLRCDAIKEDIYVWAFSKQNPKPSHSFRDKPPIASRLGPPIDALPKPPTDRVIQLTDRVTHTTAGKEICKRFNSTKCTRGDDCIFAHVCWHQHCQGPHPGKGCTKKT